MSNNLSKGEYGGSCNITACQKPNSATWFNHSTEKYYCEECAKRLNEDEFNKRDAMRLFGRDLCTLIKQNCYNLIMLPNPIVVRSEEIKEGDTVYTPNGVVIAGSKEGQIGWLDKKGGNFLYFGTEGSKIIAGIEGLPTVNISLVADEVGWVDVEKLADEFFKGWSLSSRQLAYEMFRKVYNFTQSLNEKKFSEEDLYKLLKLIGSKGYYVETDGSVYANAFNGGRIVNVVKEYTENLSKQEVYNVELEMEIIKGCSCQAKKLSVINSACSERNRCTEPKITNNSITITKIIKQ